ncbi:MAG TPA: OmpA family protein [Acidobacteriota bacterium]|nr:OmpA family protein [Acidobacteriota bacterium]
MKKALLTILICSASVLGFGPRGAGLAAQESEEQLHVVRFPERKNVKIDMMRSSYVPGARMRAEMEFREGQMRIKVRYDDMKPAVLFGGDVTAYVLWAVNRDGGAQNLGELWVRPDERDDEVRYSTGLRTFALMVTAEPYYQVSKPSAMVIFKNAPSGDPQAPSDPLTFDDFTPAPNHGFDDLSSVGYDGEKPLDVVQAEKVYQLAQDMGADQYASDIMSEADLTLRQSQQMARSSRSRGGAREFARKSVASSNEAIKITLRRKEAEELERQIAQRQARMEELRREAESAQERAEEARQQARQIEAESQRKIDRMEAEQTRLEQQKTRAENAVAAARSELDRLQERQQQLNRQNEALENQNQSLTDQNQTLESQNRTLESEISEMRQEQEALQAAMADLRQEKEVLQDRLQGALSEVAETRSSARGFIVNLPDILFDTNEAELKSEARLALAKLAGILLIMTDLNLRVEGHTDSTGTPAYNLRLSQQRAESVFNFLARQGIGSTRMTAVGYGQDRPIADNSTAQGRRQNRRVEIVIAEGEVAEEESQN